jgi:hypothetical protein
MWTDPLDELIAELETVAPPPSVQDDLPRLEDVQLAVHAILNRKPGEPDPRTDPRVRQVLDQMRDRVLRARGSNPSTSGAAVGRLFRPRPSSADQT